MVDPNARDAQSEVVSDKTRLARIAELEAENERLKQEIAATQEKLIRANDELIQRNSKALSRTGAVKEAGAELAKAVFGVDLVAHPRATNTVGAHETANVSDNALAEPAGWERVTEDDGAEYLNPPKGWLAKEVTVPAREAKPYETPIAAEDGREVDWVDVTGWGAFKGHAIPVDAARYIAEKINLYAEHRTTPPDASAIREAADLARACLAGLVSAGHNSPPPQPEQIETVFWELDAALAGAKP